MMTMRHAIQSLAMLLSSVTMTIATEQTDVIVVGAKIGRAHV